MAATAVPSPGSIHSTARRMRSSSPIPGNTTAHKPICQTARSGTPAIASG